MKKQVNWRKQEFVPKKPGEKPMAVLHSIDEIPRSELYKVFRNGKELPVFHTEFFDYVIPVVRKTDSLDFEIRILEPFDKAVIRPLSRQTEFIRTAQGISLTLRKPEKLVLEIDEDLLRPLYLLCEAYIEKPENVTHHFQKGQIYNVNCLRLTSGDTVYMEEGSVVCGRIYSRMADDIRIVGNGILYGSVWHNWDENSGEQMLMTILGERIHIEGITIVDGGSWNIVPIACKDVAVHNVNILSKVITSDGIDIVGCEDVLVEDCFIRTNDDCISVKGCAHQDASGCCDTKRVLVKDSLFWNAEFGNVLEIGYETQCGEICDIIFRNCDILHCEYEGNQSGGVLTIHNADRAHVHNISYENIRVEDAQEKFIDIKTLDSKYSTDRRRGMISDIYFKDIAITGGSFPVSIIRGYEMANELCRPRDFYFENIVILGKPIKNRNDLRMVVELADGLKFV